MGGAISVPGNMTPVAEFNTYADAIATARIFALTSPRPSSTLPPPPPPPPSTSTHDSSLPPYPAKFSKILPLALFPLDITSPHLLHRSAFTSKTAPLTAAGSPLAEWTSAFLASTFHKITTLHTTTALDEAEVDTDVALSLHDPLCIWYVLTHPGTHPDSQSHQSDSWTLSPSSPQDIRVETSGQWTRGMCVVDRRDRKKLHDNKDTGADEAGEDGEVPGDTGRWLDPHRGNRINRVGGSPGVGLFEKVLLDRIFG